MKWYQDVYNALALLNGKAHLSKIYPEVYKLRKSRNDTLGDNYEEWVRNALQQNSRGKGHDCFEPVKLGSGVWKIKKKL